MTLGFLALAWLLGIAAAAHTGADPAATVAAAGFLGAASFAVRPRPATLVIVAAGAALILAAAWRYEDTVPTVAPDAIQRLNDGDSVRFRAAIDDEPQERTASVAYRLSVREAWLDGRWQEASGAVLMTTAAFPRYEYGDLLEVRGELSTPPVLEDFDYREYLARQGIRSLAEYPETTLIGRDHGNPMKAAIIGLRAELTTSLQGALPEPESSLAAGILLGARSALPRDLKDDMDATGTSHLIAVSGQNVAMLAAAVIAALAWLLGRRVACWAALVAIVAYAAFVGAEPSVVRAAIMGGLFVLSVAFGRQNTGWVALLAAAALMTALDPQIVHDVSFQLSFAAVLGLIVLAPPLRERLDLMLDRIPPARDLPLSRPAADLMAMSLAAILFTLPITAVNFHQISLVAPFANLLAVPAFAAVAATSGLVAVVGLFSPGAADALAFVAWPPAAYMVAVVQVFAALPVASVHLDNLSAPHAAVYYALLTAAILALRRLPTPLPELSPPRPAPRAHAFSTVALALVLSLSSMLVWLTVSTSEPPRLSVTVLDVGQGDAILVQTPTGNRVLIDGGPGGSVLKAALGRHLPFYDRRLDLLVLTHPQADHVGGFPALLETFEVDGVLQAQAPAQAESALAAEWQHLASTSQIPIVEAARGQRVDIGGGAALTVLSAPNAPGTPFTDENDSSIVLRLTYGRFAMLLTGDIGAEGEAALERAGTNLEATVLKVAHHGSRSSSSKEFLDSVDSSVALISAGRDNRFGHPAPEVLQRLDGQAVFRTDQRGDITVTTDGGRVWVSTQR